MNGGGTSTESKQQGGAFDNGAAFGGGEFNIPGEGTGSPLASATPTFLLLKPDHLSLGRPPVHHVFSTHLRVYV
jgi:hypothetical protein